eukprot:3390794-Pyramimonas_sp.AAC.1
MALRLLVDGTRRVRLYYFLVVFKTCIGTHVYTYWAQGESRGRKWGTGQGGAKRGRVSALCGVECTLAVVGTGGPVKN